MIGWLSTAPASHKDLIVQFPGAQGKWKVRLFQLSSGKPEYPVALPARHRDGRDIHPYLDLISNDRHIQAFEGEHVT